MCPMFDEFNDGFCPECMLKGKQTGMILNGGDFWECPDCHLQAHSAAWGFLAILRTRGRGDFKTTKATEHVDGVNLAKVGVGEHWNKIEGVIRSEEDLKSYLEREVEAVRNQAN